MTTVTAVKAREQFAELVNRTAYGKERVVLTKRGRRLVAMIPVEDLALLERFEKHLDLQAAEASLTEARKKGTISWEDLKAELGL